MHLLLTTDRINELLREEYHLESRLACIKESLQPYRSYHGESALNVFVDYFEDSFKLVRITCMFGMWRSLEGIMLSKSVPKTMDIFRCKFPLMFVSKSMYNQFMSIFKKCTLSLFVRALGVEPLKIYTPSLALNQQLFPKRNGFIKRSISERSIYVKTSDGLVYSVRVNSGQGHFILHLDIYIYDYVNHSSDSHWFECTKTVEYSCEYIFYHILPENRMPSRIERMNPIKYYMTDELTLSLYDIERLKIGFEYTLKTANYTMICAIGMDIIRGYIASQNNHEEFTIERMTACF
jgi:hypothetical protein